MSCQECSKGNGYYCQPCNSLHFRDNFTHWTSGNLNLDELIRNSQLNAELPSQFIEWIEYSNLENIELVDHGGFGSVYKAIWKDCYIKNWNFNKSQWQRQSYVEVAVKKLRNVTHVSSEFLNEVDVNLNMNIMTMGIATIRIYGVTRDPQSREYAIITEFKNGGNLREIIKKNHNNLTWKSILKIFYYISNGLLSVHMRNYHHKDLHSGNILNSLISNYIRPVISDFGLCRPSDQSSTTDRTSRGVLPFVAPEVLLGKNFTNAADIYGFGMIMSEVISGEPPFIDRDYDEYLALTICSGQRPQIPEYTPEPYAELMKRCWDPVPTNRPMANELLDHFVDLGNVLNDRSCKLGEDRKLEIKEAFSQEREEVWKARLAELATNPIPLKKSQNMLTSKRLDYAQYLSQNLLLKIGID
ncbi:hypothetical protein RclHR1_18550002 [Rhizophagus clarus]|uniref:Kinase-like domain-containing protein n=1 Tax=Rhizophagus clarus TaxID=94130 RepID=A0A2Z6QML7_9GLOM|nr:hypothetical protein RclHR1_18550002 [Rhizophagus clarus]GES99710.1 kinase-like domain-containing protein [Rhizophagus clarus]